MSARVLVSALLIFAAATAAGAELGRLFFTPVQRETLDNARAKNLRIEIGTDNESAQPAAAPVPQNVSVDGLVRRSDGANTVWINNNPVADRQKTGLGITTSTRSDNRVRLTVPGEKRSVDLKVGQSVEILSGTIEEGYTRRAARKPDTPPPVIPPGAPSSAARKDEVRGKDAGAQGPPRTGDAQK